MFGWRKRNDGFEWREYVRTTILVRREKRRQKLDEVREAAVNKVKEAGEKGARAGAAGAEKVGQAAKAGLGSAARSLHSASSTLWERSSAVVSRLFASIGGLLGGAGRAVSAYLGSGNTGGSSGWPSLNKILLGVTAIAGFWAAARYTSFGIDGEVKLAAWIAVAALGISGLMTLLAMPQGAGAFGYLKDGLSIVSRAARNIPLPSFFSGLGSRTLAAGTLVLILALGGGYWISTGGKTDIARLSSLSSGSTQSGQSGPSRSVSGRAVAVSGDSLRVAGKVIRLDGIEAPERNQKCGLAGSKRWDCGNAAAQAMASRLRSKTVRCDITDARPTGVRGVCLVDGNDLAADLVKSGHVFAEKSWFARYSGAEGEARAAKAGLWRGEAERPSEYRAKRWDEARKTAPEGCPIKGQLSSDGRVYVLPWSPQYDRIKIRAAKGERWFCSEAEAQAAGWKPIEQS